MSETCPRPTHIDFVVLIRYVPLFQCHPYPLVERAELSRHSVVFPEDYVTHPSRPKGQILLLLMSVELVCQGLLHFEVQEIVLRVRSGGAELVLVTWLVLKGIVASVHDCR